MARPPEDLDFAAWRASGDPEALARVFDRTAPKLLLLASHWCKDAAAAEDLVQTTFLQAMRDGAQWRAGQPVLPWLAGILAHRAADARRRDARRAAEPLAAQGESQQHGPVQAAIDGELLAQVTTAIDALEPPYRDVLVLRLLHGLEPTAIAHALGRAPATVRKQLERGLLQLRAVLPASVGAVLALLLVSGGGLAAMKASVLSAAGGSPVTAASAAGLILGGITMKKVSLIAMAAVLAAAVFTWWPRGAPAVPPTEPSGVSPGSLATDRLRAGPASTGPATAEGSAERTAAQVTESLTVDVSVTARGVPLPGALLELHWFEGPGTDGAPASVHPLRCDEGGRALWQGAPSSTLRTVHVVAATPDRYVWCTPEVVTPDEIAVELTATAVRLDCELRGTVRDGTGEPIADATVSLNTWMDTRTTNDGTYLLRTGTGVDSRPIVAWADGYAQQMHSLTVPEGAVAQRLDFTLPRGGRIAGRVVDETGAVVAGASVLASGAIRATETDGAGQFSFTSLGLTSRHLVEARAPGVGVGSASVTVGAGDVEVVLQRGLGVTLAVHGPTGGPVPFAAIAIYTARSGMRTRGHTGTDGRLLLEDLQAGPCELRVLRRGLATRILALDVQPAMPEMRIDLERGKILRGQVVDDAGGPIAGVSVYANLVRGVEGRTVTGSVHTDADGRFALADLPSEPCTVHAFHRDYQRGSEEIAGAADAEVRIHLAAAASVAGRVVDARTQKPVSEFTVRVTSAAVQLRGDRERHAAADGRWRFTAAPLTPGLPVGVEVHAAGYAPGRCELRAERDPDPDRHPLLLQPGATFAGTVRDALTGAPIADTRVQLAPPATQDDRSTATDATGRFVLRDIAAGPLRLAVVKRGYPVAMHGPFEVGVGASLEVDLRHGRGAVLRGRLDGFRGDGRRLHVMATFDSEIPEAAVASDGSFALPPLGVGEHSVYLVSTAEHSVTRLWTLTVPDHDLDDVVLPASDGDGSLRVTVVGVEDGIARVIPLGTVAGPVGLGQRHLRFTGGAFVVEGLPAGPCRVTVTKDQRSATREVEVKGATALEIRL